MRKAKFAGLRYFGTLVEGGAIRAGTGASKVVPFKAGLHATGPMAIFRVDLSEGGASGRLFFCLSACRQKPLHETGVKLAGAESFILKNLLVQRN